MAPAPAAQAGSSVADATHCGAVSSAGRAPRSQCGGQGFDPPRLHQLNTPCLPQVHGAGYDRSTRLAAILGIGRRLFALMSDHGTSRRGRRRQAAFGAVVRHYFCRGVPAYRAAVPLVHGGSAQIWAIVVAAVFLVAGLFLPQVLRPLNLVWLQLGLLLHRIISIRSFSAACYLAVTPVALVHAVAQGAPAAAPLRP